MSGCGWALYFILVDTFVGISVICAFECFKGGNLAGMVVCMSSTVFVMAVEVGCKVAIDMNSFTLQLHSSRTF